MMAMGWSRKYDKCVVCGTTSKSHYAKGCCHRCYKKLYQSQKYYPYRNSANRKKERIKYGDSTKAERDKRYRANNPEKIKARSAVCIAVASGKITKSDRCAQCGQATQGVQAHHFSGYDHPLVIIWLCPQCHQIAG